MGQIKVTDDLLKDVLPKVSDELIKEWESETVENHEFSTGFNRRMKKIILKHKNKQLMKELMVVGKFAAALLLLIGVCFFGSTMVARANLDVLFKKIEVALEDSSMYVYDEKTDSYIFNMYEPGYVPEGYEEYERMIDEKNVIINKLLRIKKSSLSKEEYLNLRDEWNKMREETKDERNRRECEEMLEEINEQKKYI